MMSMMDVVYFVLTVIMRKLLASLLSLLKENDQLLHGLLGEFIRYFGILYLLLRSNVDDLADLVHT